MPLEIDTPSRAVAVVQFVERRIAEEQLRPGDRIGTKVDLQAEVGVARATLNEAVRMLHDRGRIRTVPGPKGGIYVAEYDPGQQMGRFLLAVGNDARSVADAIQLRDALEYLVLAEATRHRTEADLEELRRLFEDIERSQQQSASLLEAIWAFHERLATMTPNRLLSSTYDGLTRFIRDHVQGIPDHMTADPDEFHRHRLEVHRQLLEVVASGDVTRVNEAIHRHNEDPNTTS